MLAKILGFGILDSNHAGIARNKADQSVCNVQGYGVAGERIKFLVKNFEAEFSEFKHHDSTR